MRERHILSRLGSRLRRTRCYIEPNRVRKFDCDCRKFKGCEVALGVVCNVHGEEAVPPPTIKEVHE